MDSPTQDEIVFIVEEDKESGGYVASCHRHGIFTQGESLDDLRSMVKDAVSCHFADGSRQARPIRLHFIRDEVVA